MASYTCQLVFFDPNGFVIKQIAVKTNAPVDRVDFNMVYPAAVMMPVAHHPARTHPLSAMLYHAPQSPSQPAEPLVKTVEEIEDELKPFEDVAEIPEQESFAASSSSVGAENKKKKCWNNVITKPAILHNDKFFPYRKIEGIDDDYSPFSKDSYPPESGNLFGFNIPQYVVDSGSWIMKYPSVIKIEIIRICTSVKVIKWILKDIFENAEKRKKNKIDYTEEIKWFAPLYRFIKHTDGTRKCTIFNRWNSNRGNNCNGKTCQFHHMCAVCGSKKHGAFNRDRSGNFMCIEVANLVAQYEALAEDGYKPIDVHHELYPMLNEHRKIEPYDECQDE